MYNLCGQPKWLDISCEWLKDCPSMMTEYLQAEGKAAASGMRSGRLH